MKEEILKKIHQEYKIKKDRALQDAKERQELLLKTFPAYEEHTEAIRLVQIALGRATLEGNAKAVSTLEKKLEQLKTQRNKLLAEKHIDPAMLEPMFECDLCQDEGYIATPYGWEQCICLKTRMVQEAYQDSTILNQIQRENFDHFDETLFSDEIIPALAASPRQNILKVKNRALEFIQHFQDPHEKGMMFHGSPGLGKTFLCSCIAKAVLDKQYTVFYQSSSELFRQLADTTFSQDSNLRAQGRNLQNIVLNTDLLIIDDLGTEIVNSFILNQLFNIINHRMIASKKIILSTNLDPSELEERYGNRIFSRLVMSFDMYRFFGEDLRWKL